LAGRTLEETPPFAKGAEVPGVGRVPGFAESAFALREGEVSDLIESPDAIYLLAPFAYSEAHAPPLDEVRERVTADARRERGEAAARERADKLLARAREIGLDQAAAEAGVQVEETGPFERVDSIPKIGRVAALTADAFALAPETPLAPKVYTTGGDAIVAALRARTPADLAGTRWTDWFASVAEGADRLRRDVPALAVAGMSLGALLGLHLAATRPAEVSALVLCGTPLRLGGAGVRWLPLLARIPWIARR